MKRCGYPTKVGPCHEKVAGPASDRCYYHTKIADGVTVPVAEYLSQGEIDALMGRKRRHGDGRHLDQYVVEGKQ